MQTGFSSRRVLSAAAALIALSCHARADAPRVVHAAPDNGDENVDPALRELRVEFDQDMADTGYSVCGGGPNFPEITGKVKWERKRVAIIPVKLKRNFQYHFSINCPAAGNFRSAAGESAEPYPVSFKTGAGGKPAEGPRLTPEQNKPAIEALRKAVEDAYSYRDLRLNGADWNKLFDLHGPRMAAAETPAAFARAAARLLENARDIHIWLKVGDTTIATHRRASSPNASLVSLSRLVPQWKKHNDVVYTGRFEDGIGYVNIATWGPKDRGDLEPALAALEHFGDARAIIVDVRFNAGGDELLAREFAGCFVARPAVYSKNVYRDPTCPDGFTAPPLERIIDPSQGRATWRGKVVVLMGPDNMSSCESFLLMMRHGAGATLIGETSYGSSGNPKPHDLGNGVTVFLPSWKDMHPDGSPLEGAGVKPDVTVTAPAKDFLTDDPVLRRALERLRG